MTTQTEGGKIEFVEYHQPALADGDYTLSVTQEIEAKKQISDKQNFREVFPDAKLSFSVLGPRFSLDPQVIDSVFPPAGSLGDHSNVLPHVVLNRSTLPWERTAVSVKKDDPEKLKEAAKRLSWLVLLLFDEGELLPVPAAPKTSEESAKTFSVGELRTPITEKVKWPGIPKESGDHDDDRFVVIDVPWSLLSQIMPSGEDLRFLAHVRKTQEATGKPGEAELAVVIGTRIPKSASISCVHLVSVEGRYKHEGDHHFVFDHQGAQDGDSIRLVSLKSWRFTCASEHHNFTGLLRHLDWSSALRIPDSEHSWLFSEDDFVNLSGFVGKLRTLQDPISVYLWNQFSASTQQVLTGVTSTPEEQELALVQALNNILKGVLIWEAVRFAKVALSPETLALKSQNPNGKDLTRLNRLLLEDAYPLEIAKSLPPSVIDFAKRHLAMGCVPLPHAMRQGNKTVSWYRGPLVPGNNTTAEFSLPIRTADELVYYDDAYGMFDVSYAAAWELGRLLALQSKSFSISFYHWKRSHARKLKDADTQLTHLPFDGPSADLELPGPVSSWFEKLTLLEGVPFHYLVPDERMLPVESIRFFQLDPIWMECLVDGAFSVGRVLRSDHEQDKSQKESHFNKLLPRQVSGFLIRSDVVAGWPGLQADGYDEPIRTEEFALEKRLLFEIDPADAVSDLNKRKISAKLEGRFRDSKIDLSRECTIESQQWLITNGEPQFLLSKRENNEVDVCAAADGKYLFSVDEGFETDLNEGKISTDLQQAFRDQNVVLREESYVSTVFWFLSDSEYQKHYLIQNEEKRLKVYRDYKLPLLRMARLSANVLLCLFEGVVQTVDLHLKPETLHFGLDKPEGDDSIPWRDQARQVIKIAELAKKIQEAVKAQTFSVAEFALEMIEGAQKVRFACREY